jgi:hypothetical protein
VHLQTDSPQPNTLAIVTADLSGLNSLVIIADYYMHHAATVELGVTANLSIRITESFPILCTILYTSAELIFYQQEKITPFIKQDLKPII